MVADCLSWRLGVLLPFCNVRHGAWRTEWLSDYGAGCVSLMIPGCLGPLSTVSSSAFPGGLVAFPFSWSAWHKHWQHMHIRCSCLHTVSEQCGLFSCPFLGQGIGSYVSSLNQVWQRTQKNCPLPVSPIPRDTLCVF